MEEKSRQVEWLIDEAEEEIMQKRYIRLISHFLYTNMRDAAYCGKNRQGLCDMRDAQAWFRHCNEHSGPFSFMWCCSVLEISPLTVLRRVKEIMDLPAPQRKKALIWSID